MNLERCAACANSAVNFKINQQVRFGVGTDFSHVIGHQVVSELGQVMGLFDSVSNSLVRGIAEIILDSKR